MGLEFKWDKLIAEALGTFLVVLCGGGAITFSYYGAGVGLLGIAITFGLAYLVATEAFGEKSGGHFNPTLSFGSAIAGKLPWGEILGYVLFQLIGASIGGVLVYAFATGRPGFSASANGMGSNGYKGRSPGGYNLVSCLFAELLFSFLLTILALGSAKGQQLDSVPMGVAYTLFHLVLSPLTFTSLNPAKSLGLAWYVGEKALEQVWLFIVFPIVGGLLGGLVHDKVLSKGGGTKVTGSG